MAFQSPHLGQEKQNRKLLEQLEEQKKRLLMSTQGGGATSGGVSSQSTANLNITPPSPMVTTASPGGPMMQSAPIMTPHVTGDQAHMTPQQRTALQHAHANSVGYFITQDSSFGNLILPVLPRFDPPKV